MSLPFRLPIKIKHPAERLNSTPEAIAAALYDYRNKMLSGMGLECDLGGCVFVVDPCDTLDQVTRRVVEACKHGDKATWSFFPPGVNCEPHGRVAWGLQTLDSSPPPTARLEQLVDQLITCAGALDETGPVFHNTHRRHLLRFVRQVWDLKDQRELPLIYIAGPFRAATPWEIEYNIRKAETLGFEVARLGGIPVIPHTMYRFFQNALPDEFWLKCGLGLLQSCNALAATVGWQESKGAQGEINHAETQLKIPIFRDGPDISGGTCNNISISLRNWIQQWKTCFSNDQT
jgi:hypothetical protein